MKKSEDPFDWVDWRDVVQTTWLFKYFSHEGEHTATSLILAYENIPILDRPNTITKAKKAWAVKKHRLPKGIPLQIYLSPECRKYLEKASKSLSLQKDKLIENILMDQSSLHHKEAVTCKKLRTESQTLRDQIRQLNTTKIKLLADQLSLKEEIAKLHIELSRHEK